MHLKLKILYVGGRVVIVNKKHSGNIHSNLAKVKDGTIFTFNGVLHDFNVDDDNYERWRYVSKVTPW